MNEADLCPLFFHGLPPSRWSMFQRAVSLVERKNLTVVETGVSSDYCNGLSTAFWSCCPEVTDVVSIDLSRSGLDGIEKKLGFPLPKIRLVMSHSIAGISSLPSESVDILFLDSDLDQELMLHEAIAGMSKLRLPAVIVADDADTKAPLLLDFLGGNRIPCKWPPYGAWKAKIEAAIEIAHPEGAFGMMLAKIIRFDGFEWLA